MTTPLTAEIWDPSNVQINYVLYDDDDDDEYLINTFDSQGHFSLIDSI